MQVAQNKIHRPAGATFAGRTRWHRMAVDQQAAAEALAALGDQRAERLVIGPVAGREASLGLGEGKLRAVDLAIVGGEARDAAEPGRDPRGIGDGARRQRVLEHLRVELQRLAVGIDIGAGKQRLQQRHAMGRRGADQLIDMAILAQAQGRVVERELKSIE